MLDGFKTWMISQTFTDNITINDENFHSFLRGEVCGRKRKQNDFEVIGYSTVR